MERITPETLIEGMATILNTDAATILSHDRKQPLPLARFILAATFCGSMMGMSTSEAGRHLGGRNHSTVLHGIGIVALIRQRYGTEKELALLQTWDRYTDRLMQQDNTDNTDMEIDKLKYRGRTDGHTWVQGNNIAIRDGVVTIDDRYIYPQTFGMFTGLIGLDEKNPRLKHEIYDGDVVRRKWKNGHYLVRFDQKRAAFRLIPTIMDGPDDGQPADMNASESYILLGNVHDNPALGMAYSECYVEIQDQKKQWP